MRSLTLLLGLCALALESSTPATSATDTKAQTPFNYTANATLSTPGDETNVDHTDTITFQTGTPNNYVLVNNAPAPATFVYNLKYELRSAYEGGSLSAITPDNTTQISWSAAPNGRYESPDLPLTKVWNGTTAGWYTCSAFMEVQGDGSGVRAQAEDVHGFSVN